MSENAPTTPLIADRVAKSILGAGPPCPTCRGYLPTGRGAAKRHDLKCLRASSRERDAYRSTGLWPEKSSRVVAAKTPRRAPSARQYLACSPCGRRFSLDRLGAGLIHRTAFLGPRAVGVLEVERVLPEGKIESAKVLRAICAPCACRLLAEVLPASATARAVTS